MVEFGEKIRQLREERGYTQQILADKLYVTRQAVSRWECGARYPDLMMSKKIAEVFHVSIDELMSGEEVKKDVDNEPVLKKSPVRYVETILYAVVICTSFVIFGLNMAAFIFPDSANAEMMTAGKVLLYAQTASGIVGVIPLIVGLLLSLQNKMVPKKIGIIMGAYFSVGIIEIVAIYCIEKILLNMDGTLTIESYLSFLIEIATVITIIFYFIKGKNQLSKLLYILSGIKLLFYIHDRMLWIMRVELRDVAIGSIYSIAVVGIIILFICETYILDKKRNKAINMKQI